MVVVNSGSVVPVGYNYSQNAVYTIIYEIVKVKLSQRKLVMNKKCNGAIYRLFFLKSTIKNSYHANRPG